MYKPFGTLVAASLLAACAVPADSAPTDTTAQSLWQFTPDPHACNVPGMSETEVRECLQYFLNQTHDPAWSDEYNCVDFSNAYCEAAAAYGVACAELGVHCEPGSYTGPYGGHAVSVVFIEGHGCVVIDPQDGAVLSNFYPPSAAGSCNTYPPDVAAAVCNQAGMGKPICAGYTRGPRPNPDGNEPCLAIAQTASAVAE